MAPILRFIISSGSKKKEHRYAWLSVAKASHSHKMCECEACLETRYNPTMCWVGLCNAPYGLYHGMVIQSQFVSGAELAIRFVNFSRILEGQVLHCTF